MGIIASGEGVEYNAEFRGGPADGLVDTIISMGKNAPPPLYFYHELKGDEIAPIAPIGLIGPRLVQKLFVSGPKPDARVAAYKLVGEAEDYGEKDTVYYTYIQSVTFEEYQKKYTI